MNNWDKQKEFYEQDIKHANDKDIFRWSIFTKGTNNCIGRISCHEGKDEDNTIDNPNIRGVGWIINPKYQGLGYGTEAAIAMINYMFNECEIDEIRTGAAICNSS